MTVEDRTRRRAPRRVTGLVPGLVVGRGAAALVAVVVVLALGAAGCQSSAGNGSTGASGVGAAGVQDNQAASDEGAPQDGGTLVVAVPAETDGWNPTRNTWSGAGAFVGSSVLESLLTMNERAEAVANLLTAWEPNATLDSWTLTLREGVAFQDGEPFDAAAVKLNHDGIDSAPVSGAALKGLIVSTTVLDDHRVQVALSQPWGAFPTSFLAGQSAMMMAPEMLSSPDHGVDHPIGTGPFTFVSWSPGDVFRVKRNPGYWQPGRPHLDQIDFKVITDEASLSAALQTGAVDLITSADPAAAVKLSSTSRVIRDWQLDPAFVMTNTLAEVSGKPNPLSNQHARTALAYATDRDAIAAAVGEGVQVPNSPFSPDNPWGMPADQNGYPDFDPARARDEVAAYEADTGESTLHFTVEVGAGGSTEVLQLLQAQWKDVGIDIDIQPVESAALISDVVGGHYEAAVFAIYTSPDPDQNHYFWSASTAHGEGNISINFTQYTNAPMEADLETGRRSSSVDDRKAAYDDLVRQINAAAVNVWLFYVPHSLIAADDVHGLQQAGALHFANFQPKPWWGDVWKSTS
ncbi:MAG: ABC transporter substrate-binding protein [Acidimicrobiales bacterium]